MIDETRIKVIAGSLGNLTAGQLDWIETIMRQFALPHDFVRADDSDFITDEILQDLGDTLRIHHCFSSEAFSKDKFEYAMETVFNRCGQEAKLAAKGNPGHDITIGSERISLKTQADKGIRIGSLWISKFMELGRGDWSDNDDDLVGLREQFLNHMKAYDRIFSLRRLKGGTDGWHYELVEIPKSLFQEAESGRLDMRHNSSQNPKPGYCHVVNGQGKYRFRLYFDGGGERKLQIQNLDKSLCKVHANWKFTTC